MIIVVIEIINVFYDVENTNKKGLISMAIAVKEDYKRALDEQKKEVRNLVMAGLEQIKEGKTKDFNTVCDSLEKKYANAFFRGENDEKMEKDMSETVSEGEN